ncbi:hypothetical protein QCA50_001711 [Cerrena zonata]|uniref:Uncharacterized protein n=1 Tax=Cerrena zonata TaxID=2478898 RepID=A0AAW0GXK5_9APHY
MPRGIKRPSKSKKAKRSKKRKRTEKLSVEDLLDEDIKKRFDIGHYARCFARLGGVFTPVGDILEVGEKWEWACKKWDSEQRTALDVDLNSIGDTQRGAKYSNTASDSDSNSDSEEESDSDSDSSDPESSSSSSDSDSDSDSESEEDVPITGPSPQKDPRDMSQYKIEHYHKIEGWTILCSIVPNLSEAVHQCVQRGHSLKTLPFTRALQGGILRCRGNDTNGLRTRCFYYINQDTSELSPPIPLAQHKLKELRGWNHPAMAALLLPINHALTDENLKLARARLIATHHDLMPRYLYPENHVIEEHHEEKGLFQGHYIIFVSNHLSPVLNGLLI